MGKLIVIEGLDGSGKQTQTKLLYEHLQKQGKDPMMISFPRYDMPSSALVRLYLGGGISDKADEVNPYAASMFFSADRYISYMKEYRDAYNSGRIILADRYTTANALHQASKLPPCKIDEYLDWLYDFEFCKLGLPKPDLVIYLDMPPEYSQALLSKRYNNDQTKKDIHEKDFAYLEKCYDNAAYVAKKLSFTTISCVMKGSVLPIEEIHAKILTKIEHVKI